VFDSFKFPVLDTDEFSLYLQHTSNLFEQHAHGSENHRRAERESRVDGEEFHGHHFVYTASIQSDGSPCIIV
jgi:hypothetical protein